MLIKIGSRQLFYVNNKRKVIDKLLKRTELKEKKNIIKAGVLNTKYIIKGKGMQRFIEKNKEKKNTP